MLGRLCIVQSLLAYKPGIRAGLVIGGSKAELLKISRKADRDAPCDQARMLDSVRTEVLHDAKPTHERRLALGLRPKPHLMFTKMFIDRLNRRESSDSSRFCIFVFISVHILAVILKKRYAVNTVNRLEA